MGEGASIMGGWLWLAGGLLFGVVLVEVSVFFSDLVEAFEVGLISHLRRLIKIITILLNAIKIYHWVNQYSWGCLRPTDP